jgi:SAM-dependent methyltransferase
MRRRRTARQARERWVAGWTAPIARLINSQAAMALITPRVPRIISLIDLQAGRVYVDIGCGTAAFAHLVAARAGLDEPPVTFDLAHAPGPSDAIAWPENLPLRDGSVDAITCLYYIRRFDDDVVHKLGEEIARVLAPGGAALVMEVAPVKNRLLNRFHTWLMRPGCAQVDLRGWGRLAAMFTECGFDAIDLVNVGPFLLPPISRVGVLLRRAPDIAREPGLA